MSGETVFLFDLDGTLVDSVYQHVLACHNYMRHSAESLVSFFSLKIWSFSKTTK